MAKDQSGTKPAGRLSDALSAASRELGEEPLPERASTPEAPADSAPPGLGGLPRFKISAGGRTPPPLPGAAAPAIPALPAPSAPAPSAREAAPAQPAPEPALVDPKPAALPEPPAPTGQRPPSLPGASAPVREPVLGPPRPALEARTPDRAGPAPAGRPEAPQPSPADPETAARPARDGAGAAQSRRTARRRPAGQSVAANDDLPSIGGLIYALEQRPTKRPYIVAASLSGAWLAIGGFFAWGMLAPELARSASFAELMTRPAILTTLATVVLPIAVFWFLAWLLYQAQDLRLRSSAMTEVAIRLAEPDRAAEQSVASLGQSVRKQVNFMNEAISKAITRAGELEVMVQNEVALLDNAYRSNEDRIHGLMRSLAKERDQLSTTSTDMHSTLSAIGSEVPALIEKLNAQQIKLAKVIEGAGQNLIALETSLIKASGQLETSLGDRTTHLEGVLGGSATQMQNLLIDRTNHLQTVLDEYTGALNTSLGNRAGQVQAVMDEYTQAINAALGNRTEQLQTVLDGYTTAINGALASRTEQLQTVLDGYTTAINGALGNRTEQMQGVFETYTRALDDTLANRTAQLDGQILERAKALDDAFSHRLGALDDAMRQSAMLIDGTVGEKARMLSSAMEQHARQLSDTLGRQATNLDETLMHGINAVRRTSENITRQSVKAIEGLAGQADMLKNVSENLLTQIGTVTSRFENQGQSIMRAANALESANYRIDQALQGRQRELVETLNRLTGTSEQIGQQLLTYRTSLDDSIADAHARTRQLTEEMARGAQVHAQTALSELERLKSETAAQTSRAVDDMRQHMTSVQREVSQQVGSMSSRLTETTDEIRSRTERAANDFALEQERLRAEAARIPDAARESTEAMRRVLAEQMRALEQLTTYAGREAPGRAISPPTPIAAEAMPAQPPPARAPAPASAPSLAAAIAAHQQAGMAARMPMPLARPAAIEPPAQQPEPAPVYGAQPGQPRAPANPPLPQMAPPAQPSPSGWSVGELLARASKDEASRPAAVAEPASAPGAPINLESISRALDPATAAAIWSRFRSGQRGIMVRSIYTAEGRGIFDEVTRRYQGEPDFRGMVDRFLVDFETMLRESEQRDPSGRQADSHLQSGSGRVYLFLAHASNRLV